MKLMYKVVTGQAEELEDNREYDSSFNSDTKKQHQNGSSKDAEKKEKNDYFTEE